MELIKGREPWNPWVGTLTNLWACAMPLTIGIIIIFRKFYQRWKWKFRIKDAEMWSVIGPGFGYPWETMDVEISGGSHQGLKNEKPMKEQQSKGLLHSERKFWRQAFSQDTTSRPNICWWNDLQLEMTRTTWSVERAGWIQTWKPLIDVGMETLKLAGFHHGIDGIGTTVQLSWNHVFPFQNK